MVENHAYIQPASVTCDQLLASSAIINISWWPGDARGQVISSYGIDYVTNGRISTTCAVLRNDTANINVLSYFQKKCFARKGLKSATASAYHVTPHMSTSAKGHAVFWLDMISMANLELSPEWLLFGTLCASSAAKLVVTLRCYRRRPADAVLVGKVSELWIYPVKSCQGISGQRARITDSGINFPECRQLRDRLVLRYCSARVSIADLPPEDNIKLLYKYKFLHLTPLWGESIHRWLMVLPGKGQ